MEKTSRDKTENAACSRAFCRKPGELQCTRLRGHQRAVEPSGVVRGVITRVPFSLLWPHRRWSGAGAILTCPPRRHEARAIAARTGGDDGLFLDLEVLVDVLAVDAQFARAAAVGAAHLVELGGVENTGLVAGIGHGPPGLGSPQLYRLIPRRAIPVHSLSNTTGWVARAFTCSWNRSGRA